MAKFIDLKQKRFGRLVVIKHVERSKQGNYKWLCKCDCKNKIITLGASLQNGKTKSCGCLQKEIASRTNTKHGHSTRKKTTRTYRSWNDMIQRCTNPNNNRWKYYGGSGITVCKRWVNSFENFLEDMGECPPGLTIERIKNKLGYYKENCCWATKKEQMRNTRRNHLITFNNKTQTMIEWSEETRIPYDTIRYRLNQGWSIEKTLTTSVRKYKMKERKNV